MGSSSYLKQKGTGLQGHCYLEWRVINAWRIKNKNILSRTKNWFCLDYPNPPTQGVKTKASSPNWQLKFSVLRLEPKVLLLSAKICIYGNSSHFPFLYPRWNEFDAMLILHTCCKAEAKLGSTHRVQKQPRAQEDCYHIALNYLKLSTQTWLFTDLCSTCTKEMKLTTWKQDKSLSCSILKGLC